jgi:hypothetical protein
VLQFQAGVFTLVFDGSATTPPIPPDSNVIGLDRLANRWLLSFDVPTTLGSLTAIPGDIVGWNGSEFGLQRSGTDTAWPLRNELTALSSLPGGGTSDRLRVQRSGNQLRLSWDPSCSLWANDYAIYAGTIGAFNSHTAIDCSDDLHDLTETIALPAGNRYYLVVPLTANAEGSYGATSAGVERPRGTAVCRAAQTPPSCP